MRVVAVIVALVLASAADARGQDHRLRLGVAATVLTEAWDRNETHEWFAGLTAGLDRQVWKFVALRGEVMALRVEQPDHGWLRGFTMGARGRWRRPHFRPVIDLAVGLSDSTVAVPKRGTTFNYLIVGGAGVELPVRAMTVDLGLRWLHVSNNGREGSGRNPDIQSLGITAGVSW
ncbi:MAG TPA: acyloxyacyl hydrolase [Vicinamibacterales bacterium]|nr:acyloxyacyl hydrolase [Vicinamibacterales bacterium]